MYGHLLFHGKVAPVSSAKFIKEAIYNALEENGKWHNKKMSKKNDKKWKKIPKKYRQIKLKVVEYQK